MGTNGKPPDREKEAVEEKQGLAPNDPVERVVEEIGFLEKDLMVVGHLPFLQKLTGLCCLGDQDKAVVRFFMGGVVCLEKEKDTDLWVIVFAVNRFVLE